MTEPHRPQPHVSLDKGASPPWPADPAQQEAAGAGPSSAPWPPAPPGAGWGSAPGGYAMPAGPPLGGWSPAPRPDVVPTWALASPWLRLGARLINVALMVVTLFVGYLVWALVLWDQGTNPGKKMLGLAVVKADSGRLCTFGDMLVRNVVFGGLVMWFVSAFTLGLGGIVDALMIFGERRQRGIDTMAGTLVVVVRR